MKKDINNYFGNTHAIFCKNSEEFNAIARMINKNHSAIGKYLEKSYNTIRLSKSVSGWASREYYIKQKLIVLDASEFLEETEDAPLFIN